MRFPRLGCPSPTLAQVSKPFPRVLWDAPYTQQTPGPSLFCFYKTPALLSGLYFSCSPEPAGGTILSLLLAFLDHSLCPAKTLKLQIIPLTTPFCPSCLCMCRKYYGYINTRGALSIPWRFSTCHVLSRRLLLLRSHSEFSIPPNNYSRALASKLLPCYVMIWVHTLLELPRPTVTPSP